MATKKKAYEVLREQQKAGKLPGTGPRPIKPAPKSSAGAKVSKIRKPASDYQGPALYVSSVDVDDLEGRKVNDNGDPLTNAAKAKMERKAKAKAEAEAKKAERAAKAEARAQEKETKAAEKAERLSVKAAEREALKAERKAKAEAKKAERKSNPSSENSQRSFISRDGGKVWEYNTDISDPEHLAVQLNKRLTCGSYSYTAEPRGSRVVLVHHESDRKDHTSQRRWMTEFILGYLSRE